MAYALERARAFGYHSIELRDFEDIDLSTPVSVANSLDRAARLAKAHALDIHSLFYSPLPVSRQAERAAEERAFGEVIALLAEYQVPVLHTRLSLYRETRSGHTPHPGPLLQGERVEGGEVVAASATDSDYRAVQKTLQRIVPVAEQHQVRIALEAHMGTIHDTAASLCRIVSSCPSSCLTASLDFANMLIACRGESLVETVRAFGSRIGYVHVKNIRLLPSGYDWNVPLRWGDINYRLVLKALKEVRYDGPLAVEYCGTGDPDVFAEDDAEYLTHLVASLGL